MKLASMAVALATAGLVSACAHNGFDAPPAAYADVDYDAWYDGGYGPFYGGYWGPQGIFYRDDGHHHFLPDTAGHFRHQDGGGFQHIQGHAPLAAHMGSHMAGGGHMAGR